MKDVGKLAGETFEGTWPFAPHYREVQGFQMHYVDEGEGEPVVLLHGEPTWGYLYRNFIDPLSESFRVIVPDHMGFGKSETPLDKNYRLSQHVHNLNELLTALDLSDITLVLHDWGGPIGLGFATHSPERVKRLVILNTAIGILPEGSRTWITALKEQGLYRDFMGNMDANIGTLLAGGVVHKEAITETVLSAYRAPFPDRESCIGAMAFPLDIPVGEQHPSSGTTHAIMQRLEALGPLPKVLIWGMQDPVFPVNIYESWPRRYPDIEAHPLEDAAHFLQEDAPAEIVSIMLDWLARHP